MLTGAGARKSTYTTPITGLTVVKVIAVNPTNEDYKTITGKELPYSLEYEVKENSNMGNREEYPLRLLVHNKEKNIFEFINFSVSNLDDIASTGSIRFIDSKGNMTWAKDIDTIKNNDKMSWFDSTNARPLKVGEYSLYTFIKVLTSYDTRAENANFLNEMEKNNITANDIFTGNIVGISKLFKWCNDSNFAISLVFTVEEKVKDDKTYDVQRILSNPDCFFYTDLDENNERIVSNYAYKAFEKLVKGSDSKEALKIKGYTTYKLQDYKKENCFNVEPSDEVPINAPTTSRWQ